MSFTQRLRGERALCGALAARGRQLEIYRQARDLEVKRLCRAELRVDGGAGNRKLKCAQ